MLKRKHWLLIIVPPLFIAIDQMTKTMIQTWMHEMERIKVIPGLFDIHFLTNEGMAFGILRNLDGPWRIPLFCGIATIALVIIFHLFRQAKDNAVLLPIALSMILSGALGNLIDRFRWNWAVVDFLEFYHGAHIWPTFNVADICISVGIFFLIIDTLFSPYESDNKEQDKSPGAEVKGVQEG